MCSSDLIIKGGRERGRDGVEMGGWMQGGEEQADMECNAPALVSAARDFSSIAEC